MFYLNKFVKLIAILVRVPVRMILISVNLLLFNKMDAQSRFSTYFFKYLRFYLKATGHDVLDENYKPNLFTYSIYIYFALFVAFMIYSGFVVETALDRLIIIMLFMISIMVSELFEYKIQKY